MMATISRSVSRFFISLARCFVPQRIITQFFIQILPQCRVAAGRVCGPRWLSRNRRTNCNSRENKKQTWQNTATTKKELLMTFHSDLIQQKLLVNIKPLHAAHFESTSDRHLADVACCLAVCLRDVRFFCCLRFFFRCSCSPDFLTYVYNEMKIVLFKKTSRLTRDFRLLNK